MRVRTIVLALIAVLMLPVIPPAQASECNGKVNARLSRTEQSGGVKVLQFVVDVEARGTRCARVDYELDVVERLAGGDERKTRISYSNKVRDSYSTSVGRKYRIQSGNSLISWEFKVRDCRLCGAERGN